MSLLGTSDSQKRSDLHPRTLLVLLAAGAVGSVAAIPYLLNLFRELLAPIGYLPTIAVLTLVTAPASIAAMYFGLQWGGALGLGAPRLQNWAWNRADPGGWRESLQWAVPVALALSGFVLIAEKFWFAGKFTDVYPDDVWWREIGAALYSGTTEEGLLRLFAMTAIARALYVRKFTRQRAIVTALFIAAGLSALFHLPEILRFHSVSWPLVGQVISNHFASGLVFGWLYYRRGIEAAMIAHGAADLVLRLSLGS